MVSRGSALRKAARGTTRLRFPTSTVENFRQVGSRKADANPRGWSFRSGGAESSGRWRGALPPGPLHGTQATSATWPARSLAACDNCHDMIGGVARRRARYLAPLALVGVIVATLLVVSSGLHSSTSKVPAKTVTNGDASHTAPRVHRAHHRSSYV